MDFGKIISAAAVSTLGVLSLIVVAVGLLAFHFFKGSPEKIKLTVWLTALVAGVMFAAAFIAQADNVKPGPAPTDTPRPTDTPIPEPSATAVPTPTATATQAIIASPTPDPTTPAPPPVADNLTGQWHDDDGYQYNITHQGNAFAVQQWLNGMASGYGQGMISGRNLRYGFVTPDGTQGQCSATVAPNFRRITGMCTNGMVTAPFTVER